MLVILLSGFEFFNLECSMFEFLRSVFQTVVYACARDMT